MKKIISLLIACVMMLAMLAVPVFAEDAADPAEQAVAAEEGESAENADSEGESAEEAESEGESAGMPVSVAEGLTEDTIAYVDPYDNGTGKNPATDHSYLVYMPVVEPSGAKSPVVVVMGEEPYTEETAQQAIDELGLEAFCKDNQCYAVFLGPDGGEWDASDLTYYDEAINLFGEILMFRNNGLFTNAQLISSQDVIYVLAEGTAADFVCDYVLNEANTMLWADYDTPTFTFSYSHVPAGVFLCNPSSDGANISLGEIGIAAVVVNGNTELIDSLAAADEATVQIENGYQNAADTFKQIIAVESDVTDGFDGEVFQSEMGVIIDVKRSQSGESFPLEQNLNWDRLEIDEYVKTLATSDDNSIHYNVYVPRNIDTEQPGTVPMMISFHGGGENIDINMASTLYPILGKENGFITVAVDQHSSEGTLLDPDNLDLFMETLFEEYPFIDQTRVYASGMSMGAGKTWTLSMLKTDYFAGVAPFHSVRFSYFQNLGYENMDPLKEGEILPMFLTGGEISNSPEFPTGDPETEDQPDLAVGAILARNQVTDHYAYDPEAGIWGIEPSYTEEDTFSNYYVMHKNYFTSADGNVYTVFANIENEGHECYPFEAAEAWKFLSQFSRVDGEIVIAE